MTDKIHDSALTIENVAQALEGAPPQEILSWAFDQFRGRIALACSFGGPTGMVALDMAMELDPTVPVYFLDTGLLFPETYALAGRAAERYGITPIAVEPRLSLEQQRNHYGDALWAREPDACCEIRKVEPQRAFLRVYDAWISGIRRDQTRARSVTPAVEWDQQFGLVKINPFATWDEIMVWTYIRAHDLPYNELHDRSYPSLGCAPCTRPVTCGEDPRAGRWSGTVKVECGLHVATGATGGR